MWKLKKKSWRYICLWNLQRNLPSNKLKWPTTDLHFSPSFPTQLIPGEKNETVKSNHNSNTSQEVKNQVKKKRNYGTIKAHKQTSTSMLMPIPLLMLRKKKCKPTDQWSSLWLEATLKKKVKPKSMGCTYNVSTCQCVKSSLPTPTLDLSIMRTLYCSYTLVRFSAHQSSACFSLNRFRLQFTIHNHVHSQNIKDIMQN